MADDADRALEIEAEHLARGLARTGAPIAAGAAGECADCGHWMPRIVEGRCGFCRDGRLPPDDWEPPARPGTMKAAIALPTREAKMAAMSIQLPASAADAAALVKSYAAERKLSIGGAAAALIERGGMPNPWPSEPPVVALENVHLDALLDEVKRRFELSARGGEALDAAVAARTAAEARLAAVQAALAA